MEALFHNLLELMDGFGYWGVFLLMMVESTFIPFPSELVIPPAAYLAAQGQMNIFWVIFFGTVGSLAGAMINYALGMWLGRPLVYTLVEQKWAKWFFLNRKKVEKAESYFLKYDTLATFIGRLIPGVRHLISLPAGFVKMRFWPFAFYTVLGAGIWVGILGALGYFFGAKQEVLEGYYGEITLFLVGFVALVALGFWFRLSRKKKRAARDAAKVS